MVAVKPPAIGQPSASHLIVRTRQKRKIFLLLALVQKLRQNEFVDFFRCGFFGELHEDKLTASPILSYIGFELIRFET